MGSRRRLRSKQPPPEAYQNPNHSDAGHLAGMRPPALEPYEHRHPQEEVHPLLTLEEDLLNYQEYQSINYLSHITLEGRLGPGGDGGGDGSARDETPVSSAKSTKKATPPTWRSTKLVRLSSSRAPAQTDEHAQHRLQ